MNARVYFTSREVYGKLLVVNEQLLSWGSLFFSMPFLHAEGLFYYASFEGWNCHMCTGVSVDRSIVDTCRVGVNNVWFKSSEMR